MSILTIADTPFRAVCKSIKELETTIYDQKNISEETLSKTISSLENLKQCGDKLPLGPEHSLKGRILSLQRTVKTLEEIQGPQRTRILLFACLKTAAAIALLVGTIFCASSLPPLLAVLSFVPFYLISLKLYFTTGAEFLCHTHKVWQESIDSPLYGKPSFNFPLVGVTKFFLGSLLGFILPPFEVLFRKTILHRTLESQTFFCQNGLLLKEVSKLARSVNETVQACEKSRQADGGITPQVKEQLLELISKCNQQLEQIQAIRKLSAQEILERAAPLLTSVNGAQKEEK